MTVRPLICALVLAAAVLATGVLAGCGDEETTVTETVSDADTSTGDGTITEPATDTSDTTAETTTSAGTFTEGEKSGPRYFETPSSNIGCYVSPQAARCDIRERNWDPPPAERPCELDYGQGIALGSSGKADFVCAGDTALGGKATLSYSQAAQRGNLRCVSRPRGITCIQIHSGHGFFISRESYRIF